MGAKKLERSESDVYLAEAIRDGRATKQELSMKALGHPPDDSLQTRSGIDIDHVRKLRAIVDSGQTLNPIVVFERPNGRLRIGNGFHRHRLHRDMGADSIWAWVVKDTDENAVLYAAGANLEFSKPLELGDKKRAVYLILDNPSLRSLPQREIGRRCGLSSASVSRFMQEYSVEKNVTLNNEATVQVRNGREVIVRRNGAAQAAPKIYENTDGQFTTLINGKCVYLAKERGLAEKRFKEVVRAKATTESPRPTRVSLRVKCNIVDWLIKRGVDVRPTTKCDTGWPDLIFPGAIARIENDLTPSSFSKAVGDVLLWRECVDPSLQAVVICYASEEMEARVRYAERLGVRFMTPQEVVAKYGPLAREAS